MFGLLGKTLKHSLSKEIHAFFGNAEYQLVETDEVSSFLRMQDYTGFNVTIPYKEQIIPFLDHLEGYALQAQSVNTIVFKNGVWVGYNTDYDGFIKLLNHYDIHLMYKKVLIIGNGGSSKTIEAVCKAEKASEIVKICRHPQNKNEIGLEDLYSVKDFDVLINTTPLGMYPHNEDDLFFALEEIPTLSCVIDIVYQPLQTKLVLKAKELGIKSVGGLYMLVGQAAVAHEHFFNLQIASLQIEQTYRQIKKMMYNIVLIGLPLSGKSKYAKILCELTNKTLIDTDSKIEEIQRRKISSIFEEFGEQAFRKMEFDYVDSIYKSLNLVISTGGGMVLNDNLMNRLKQNGVVFFLDKNPDRIANLSIQNRPLIQGASDVYRLAKERNPLYKKYADYIIHIEQDTVYHAKEMEGIIDEYLSY